MKRLELLKKSLKPGSVFRRKELARTSKSVDRHLQALLKEGRIRKVSPGVYYYPEMSAFGPTPPQDTSLIRTFLNDDRFLVTSPNFYNGLGVGTTQLYNSSVVYNHKRHGEFKLGNRIFRFQLKHHFPKKVTTEFLIVDLVNNIDKLAEERSAVLDKALAKASTMDRNKLKQTVKDFGNARTQKFFAQLLQQPSNA